MKVKKTFMVALIFAASLLFLGSVSADTYNNYSNSVVSCGDGLVSKIPSIIPQVVSIAYTIIQIAVPVVLVVIGTLDLFKGITAQKEDEIKKGQQMFIKRLISAAIVFFVFAIVKIIISFAADDPNGKIMQCTECFIKNKCDEVKK